MAQAALRGQAQAQAAMMLNPRNIQAMAEHMGIRQPFNPAKHGGRKQGSNASTPTSQSPVEPEIGNLFHPTTDSFTFALFIGNF